MATRKTTAPKSAKKASKKAPAEPERWSDTADEKRAELEKVWSAKAEVKKRTVGHSRPKPQKVSRVAAHGVFGNRGTIWPEAWKNLSEAYGGNVKLAAEIGVQYNTLYRWIVKGHPMPPSSIKLIGMLAAAKGLPSPV